MRASLTSLWPGARGVRAGAAGGFGRSRYDGAATRMCPDGGAGDYGQAGD